MTKRKPLLDELAEHIGYRFGEPALLKLALTHASARLSSRHTEDNERLEFLGDRVLGLAVAELLHARFPDSPEGDLARWLNRLVRAETCLEIAEAWDLGRYVVMSPAEAGSGGRQKKTILANACEAVLGAIFLDSGYAPARDIVHRFWSGHLALPEEAIPDAKSVLQEWAQGRKLALPCYVEIAREGPDHKPCFTAEVHVEGIPPERGQGPNKRAAEQAAAEAMLRREGVWRAAPRG